MAERPLDADRETEIDDVRRDEMRPDDGARILRFPTVDRRREPEPDVRLRDVLGCVLREERLDQERTLADVADDANVSLPYLSEVERGVKDVSSDLLDAIADALDLPLDEVLERAVHHIRGGSTSGSGLRMLAA